MTSSFILKVSTPEEWTRIVLDNFDEFLADHADCEKKASAMALNFISKSPEKELLFEPLISLALEELQHYKQVVKLMLKRKAPFNKHIHEDPYVNQLLSFCRTNPDDRLLDRMIVISIVEARGAERFELLARALESTELKQFYQQLYIAEKKHGSLFIDLAQNYFRDEEIEERLNFFLDKEMNILLNLPWRPSLH